MLSSVSVEIPTSLFIKSVSPRASFVIHRRPRIADPIIGPWAGTVGGPGIEEDGLRQEDMFVLVC